MVDLSGSKTSGKFFIDGHGPQEMPNSATDDVRADMRAVNMSGTEGESFPRSGMSIDIPANFEFDPQYRMDI